MPQRRDAAEALAICNRYGLPYNTGPLRRQFGSVVRKIVELALPPLPSRGGSEPDREEACEAPEQGLAAAA